MELPSRLYSVEGQVARKLERAFHVELVDAGVPELHRGEGQLLAHLQGLALVGFLVDALLVGVDLNQPLFAGLQAAGWTREGMRALLREEWDL